MKSEARSNSKAHEGTTNSIINLDEFTDIASKQGKEVAVIPEFDRTTLATTENLRDALEAIKGQAFFDWSRENGERFTELEMEVEDLSAEKAQLKRRVREDEKHLITVPKEISASALRRQRRETIND